MTRAERKLLIALARAAATRIIQTRAYTDLIAAVDEVELENGKGCGVVGYPDGIRRTCELDSTFAHEYHQEGRIRWIGYYRTEGSPSAEYREYRDTAVADGQRMRDLQVARIGDSETIGRLMSEVERLKSGRFTKDEIHAICHNLHQTVDAQAFADGCATEQRRLYGCAPDRDALEQIRSEQQTDRQVTSDLREKGHIP